MIMGALFCQILIPELDRLKNKLVVLPDRFGDRTPERAEIQMQDTPAIIQKPGM
jgi:hypothetical protein